MIKHLILNNLILVDSCEIHFAPSFNVVTGETGAGKTVLIEAIGLTLGCRADTSLIRKNSDRAYVEIGFDIQQLSSIRQILEEAGLTQDVEEFLVIRREISKDGKNRAFVNRRLVPLHLLQKIGAQLVDLMSQQTHQILRTDEMQRSFVDLFGELHEDLKTFQSHYHKEKELQKKLIELKKRDIHRERDIETWNFQLHEIESAEIKEGEEEAVYKKYQCLMNAKELTEKIGTIVHGLTESPSAILPQLARFYKICHSLLSLDPSFSETMKLIQEAQVALTEALRTLHLRNDELENNPHALSSLEQRLGTIAKIKRKYGQTFEEIEIFRQKIKQELSQLENFSDEMQRITSELAQIRHKVDQSAMQLTAQRKIAAAKLQKILTEQVQELNMSGAEVSIEILPQARSDFGDDWIQFWLKANRGEHPCLVKEHSSGGELSRLLFAIKIALAEKNNTPTLIFDEIDANVGGTTALTIGEKLKKLGQCRQVICITHFPQVASKADTHFSVQKFESQGRTLTEIKQLTKKQRELELLRMIGGKQLV